MPNVRAQVVLQGGTNLPEDRFVNVFHFDSPEADLLTAVTFLSPPLHQFYGDMTAIEPGSGVGIYLSQFVLRTYEIRWYDMADPEPRVPIITTGLLPSDAGGDKDFPEEVAICLSLMGAPPVTPRRRGRLYLGPLKSTVAIDATGSVPCRVSGGVSNDIASFAGRLLTQAPSWCIWSPTSLLMVPVEGGFVDNAFDSQRRRGPGPSLRVGWPLP